MDIKKTWSDFRGDVKNKKLFLFGVGNGASYFFQNCASEFMVSAVIDNDKNIQGFAFEEFYDGRMDGMHQGLMVTDISVLDEYPADQIVVLICSLLHHVEIEIQLREYGVRHIYILSDMGMDKINKQGCELTGRELKNINEQKILVYSVHGYCGHCKYIVEELLRRNQELDIVWITDDIELEVKNSIRLSYRKKTKKYIEELETSKIWLYDNPIPMFANKQEGQIYIQVKHWAGVTLKKFGLDVERVRASEKLSNLYGHDSALMDYLFVGSDFDEKTCRRAFEYDGKVLNVGSPRSDCLFENMDIRTKVCRFYKLDMDCHWILYAPTFREWEEKEAKDGLPENLLDMKLLKTAMEKKYGGKWGVLLRLHPLCKMKYADYVKEDYVIDVSEYSDSQELIVCSDMVITDYSSIMFEPAFVKKPVILFAPDWKEYVKDRGFLIDYETLPFPIVESNEQLIENIEKFNYKEYEQKVTQFLDAYGVHEDGHASERAADFILNLLKKE